MHESKILLFLFLFIYFLTPALGQLKANTALVRIFTKAGNQIVSEGSGFFVSADGVLVTTFELIRTVLESQNGNAEFILQNGQKLSEFEFLDCDQTSKPCLLKLRTRPKLFLELGSTGPTARLIGIKNKNLTEMKVEKSDLSSIKLLAFEEGAVLLGPSDQWLRILSRNPSPEGPSFPALLGIDPLTLKKKLLLPSESIDQARKHFISQRLDAANALEAKYVKAAYASVSDRKSWSTDLFRSVNFGNSTIFSALLPRWFMHCESSPAYSLDCNDATGDTFLRVKIKSVDENFLQSLTGKPFPGSNSSEPITCKDASGIETKNPLMFGYECQYIYSNDRYQNAFSIHSFVQKKKELYEIITWSRDPTIKSFVAHLSGLLRLSAVQAGKK